MRSWIFLALALVALSLVAFLYKVRVLQYPLATGDEPATWRVEVALAVAGTGERTDVEVPLPRTSGYQQLISESVRSGRLRFAISEAEGLRTGRWNGRLDGTTNLSYETTFVARSYAHEAPDQDERSSYPSTVEPYLESSPGIPVDDTAIVELARELQLDGVEKVKLVGEIFSFLLRELGQVDEGGNMDAIAALQQGRGNELGRARLFCSLARRGGVPCRVLVGVGLRNGSYDELRYWNEVYLGDGWVPYDASSGDSGTLPPDRLSLGPVMGHAPVLSNDVDSVSMRVYVQSEIETYVELVRRRRGESQTWLERLSPLFLPVRLQNTLRILLIVPLGALVMCVLRNVVGIRTFGMFMPMLIALALTGTGLAWGTFFLFAIIAVALVTRIWIQRLYLLLAARIAFILTLVILLMVFLFAVGEQLALPSTGVGAFPFVIMTMIVERLSVSLEEEGVGNTLRRAGSTLAAIYLTYAVIHARVLQTVFLVFPELLLLILAALLVVGRYTGYRMTELIRFRELAAESPDAR
jgi:hypothetical protein